MALRVNRNRLHYALCSGPTRHWGATLRRAQSIIDGGTICVWQDHILVDNTAWRKAMSELHALPYGGRHVWKARAELWRVITSAIN